MMAVYNLNAQQRAWNLSCTEAASAVTRRSGYLLFAVLLCGFVWPCPSRAASVIADLGQTVVLNAEGTVAFQGATVDDSLNFSAPVAFTNPFSSPSTSTSTPLTNLLPTTGDPKDKAEGSMEVLFEFGTPVVGAVNPQDTITFTSFAEASAVTAQNSIGENASALVFLEGTVEFSSDPNNLFFPPNTQVGTLTIPNTFVPDPYEIGEVRVFQDSISVADEDIGAGDLIVPILTNRTYVIRVQNGLDVPFGIDPLLNRTISATIAAIPEPSSFAIGAMHLIGLLTYGRRRGDGTQPRVSQPGLYALDEINDYSHYGKVGGG